MPMHFVFGAVKGPMDAVDFATALAVSPVHAAAVCELGEAAFWAGDWLTGRVGLEIRGEGEGQPG